MSAPEEDKVPDHPLADGIVNLMYDELRTLAGHHLRRERPGHTLQTTAIVHELYLRLVKQRSIETADRSQVLAAASNLMRRILVDHARGRLREKRGGGAARVVLHEALVLTEGPDVELLALHEAMKKLASLRSREARVVELRFFGGLTMEEIARHLGVTTRTVDEDWRHAREWLRNELTPDETKG